MLSVFNSDSFLWGGLLLLRGRRGVELHFLTIGNTKYQNFQGGGILIFRGNVSFPWPSPGFNTVYYPKVSFLGAQYIYIYFYIFSS